MEPWGVFVWRELRLTNVGSVDEAEKVEDGHGWDDAQVNLQPQFRFGLLVKDHQGLAMPNQVISIKQVLWAEK